MEGCGRRTENGAIENRSEKYRKTITTSLPGEAEKNHENPLKIDSMQLGQKSSTKHPEC
jgi:hypothetical protein